MSVILTVILMIMIMIHGERFVTTLFALMVKVLLFVRRCCCSQNSLLLWYHTSGCYLLISIIRCFAALICYRSDFENAHGSGAHHMLLLLSIVVVVPLLR